MNRIQINGVWYVPESERPKQELAVTIAPTHFGGVVIESGKYVFEAIRTNKEGSNNFYKDIIITFTDKRGDRPWPEEHWDNNSWFRDVWRGNIDAFAEIPHICPQGVAEFKAFLDYLVKEKWL